MESLKDREGKIKLRVIGDMSKMAVLSIYGKTLQNSPLHSNTADYLTAWFVPFGIRASHILFK